MYRPGRLRLLTYMRQATGKFVLTGNEPVNQRLRIDDVWTKLSSRLMSARVRTAAEPDEHGWRAGQNINELLMLSATIDALIDDEIVRGRQQGAPWTTLGGSKQFAFNRYTRATERRQGDTERAGVSGEDDAG